jgi:copper chaperone CopZ
MRLNKRFYGSSVLVAFLFCVNVPSLVWAMPVFRATGLVVKQPTKRVTVAISGMDCKGCETGISGELMRTPGVIAATVSYERQEAVVDYDSAKITPAGIIAAIKGAGFGARLRRN